MNSELKPFKAYFEYVFKDTIKNKVNEDSWNRLFIEDTELNTRKIFNSTITKKPSNKGRAIKTLKL